MDTLSIQTRSYNMEAGKNGKDAYTFEEAIGLTTLGKFHYGLLLICGLCLSAVMIEIMSIGFIIPLTKCDLESSVMEQGFLASAGFLGIVVSSHAMGFLADTWGRVRTLKFTLCLSAISTVISAFSVNIVMLIVFRFCTGFFIAGGQACIFSICGEFHSSKSRVRHVTLISGFFPLALIYLPAISMVILPLNIDLYFFGLRFSSWRCLLIANASFTGLGITGLCFLPETPKYVLAQGNEAAALATLKKIFVRNTGLPESSYPVHHVVLNETSSSLANVRSIKGAVLLVWSQTVQLFRKERCFQTINISSLMFIVYGISQGIFVWFPFIFNEIMAKDGSGELVCETIVNMDVAQTASSSSFCGILDTFMYKVFIIIGVVQCIFFLILAYSIDFLGKKNMLMAYIGSACVCVVGIHWTSSFPIAIVLLTLIMCVGNCGAILATIAMEFYPTNINAMGMCFIMMIGRLGAAVGSNFIGPILLTYCNNFFWTLTFILGFSLMMCFILPDNKRRKQQQIDVIH